MIIWQWLRFAKAYELYCDPSSSFNNVSFRELIDLIACHHDTMTLMWVLVALDDNEAASEYVAFKCGPTHYPTIIANIAMVTHGVLCTPTIGCSLTLTTYFMATSNV